MSAAAERRARLREARASTDALWPLLRPGVIRERPIPERHRLIFYLGHLEAFDWNLLGRETLGLPSFHPSFDTLFAFGIDPPLGELPQDGPGDWPADDEIARYNERVRATLDALVAELPPDRFEAAIEHRLMHAETLAYAFHNLPFEMKARPADAARPAASVRRVENPFVTVRAGDAVLGKDHDGTFGWDNEYARHTVRVEAFRISKYKVTNGEYLRFVESGGPVPHFWFRRGGAWFERGMFEPEPLRLDVPVYVTATQAAAYAEFRSASLPSEAQFARAAEGVAIDFDRADAAFGGWDRVAVDATPAGESAWGVAQLVGNGWEWTSTVFAPFPGFEPFPFYPGYSANFFDGAHVVVKGGSCRTARALLRPSFRNWYRPEYPYVYGAFRLVESAS